MMNSISQFSAPRKGVSGLMSGLDTDEIVKGMTSATRNKMTKLMQSSQKTAWKMDAYRSVSTKLIGFSEKYMSFTSPSNIFSDKFFNNTTITPTGANSKYVTATGSSSTLRNLSITSIDKVAKAANYTSDVSLSGNKITTGELDFSAEGKVTNNFAGETINVTYGGKAHSVTFGKDFKETDPAKVAEEFNRLLGEIKISDTEKLGDKMKMDYNATDKKFEIGLNNPDDKSAIMIIGASSTKTLAAMGFEVGATLNEDKKIVSEGEVDPANFETKLTFNDTIKGKSLTFNLNGLNKSITFGDDVNFANINEFNTYVNDKLSASFGANRVTSSVSADGKSLEFGVFKPKSGGGYEVDTASKLTFSSSGKDLMGEKGLFGIKNNTTNKVDIYSSFESSGLGVTFDADGKGIMVVNDVEIAFNKNDSIKSVIDKINKSDAGVTVSYMTTSDNFSVIANEKGAHGRIEFADKGGSNLTQVIFGKNEITDADVVNKGQDSEITIKYDGGEEQKIIRAGDSFEVDGVNITLAADAAEKFVAGDPIRFTSVSNVDDMVKTIKEMVTDFNEISALVNGQLGTKPNRSYLPLTDEQKSSMSEDEIKIWEEQAKAGLLFGDSDLRMLSSELRFAFSFDVTDAATLKDMGITTSNSYRDNGKITIDEEKLKKALSEDIDGVKAAFLTTKTDPKSNVIGESGFMERVKAVTDKYAGTTGTEKGKLIQLAGLKDSVTEKDSILQKQRDEMTKDFNALKRTLKLQEDRYYSQFTALEQYISQMNAQSSWLTDQLG